MTQKAKSFLEFLSSNQEIAERFNQLAKEESVVQATIEFAGQHGFELTEADLKAPCGEIDNAELEQVAGGGKCTCFAGGGGSAEGEGSVRDRVCGCVLYGSGDGYNEYGAYKTRCSCPMYGSGYSVLD